MRDAKVKLMGYIELERFKIEVMRAATVANQGTLERMAAAARGPVGSTGPAVEPYVTLRAAASALGFSPCTLWRWGVPGHRLAGRRRFKISEITQYLESEDFKQRADALRKSRT